MRKFQKFLPLLLVCVLLFSGCTLLNHLTNSMDHLPVKEYLNNIYIPILSTVAVSFICPLFVHLQMEEGWLRLIAVGCTCVASVGLASFFIGFTKHERAFFLDKALRVLKIRK